MSFLVKLFPIILLVNVSLSTVRAADCLSLALKSHHQHPQDHEVNNWVDFYTYVSAVYTQLNTNNASTYADDFDLLTIDTTKYVSQKVDDKLLSFLQELFSHAQDNRYDYWLDIIIKGQKSLDELQLKTPKGVGQIHDAATYFDQNNTPPLCSNQQLPSWVEAKRILSDYQKNVSDEIALDPRFKLVDSFRKSLILIDDDALKMGAEIELFHEDYFDLVKEFLGDARLREIVQSGEFPAEGVPYIKAAVPEIKTVAAKQQYKLDVSQISSLKTSLPKDLLWATLALNVKLQHGSPKNSVHVRARLFFDEAPMCYSNYLLIYDPACRRVYYGADTRIVEWVHQRPYKNAAAYLESLVLLSHDNKSLMNGILDHKKQLKNTYTHHVHMSYKNIDLSLVGILLQDSIALTMLANNENIFENAKKYISYKKDLKINDKSIIRIAPDEDLSRIEFRRQFGGWPYDKFISWIYDNVFLQSYKVQELNIKNFNTHEFIGCCPMKYSTQNNTIEGLNNIATNCSKNIKNYISDRINFFIWRENNRKKLAFISDDIRLVFTTTTPIVYEMLKDPAAEKKDKIVEITEQLAHVLLDKSGWESDFIYPIIETMFDKWPDYVEPVLRTFLEDSRNSDQIIKRILNALQKLAYQRHT